MGLPLSSEFVISWQVEGVGAGSLTAAGLYSQFDEQEAGGWDPAEGAPYHILTDTFNKIGDTTKRLEITLLLTNTFRGIIKQSPSDLLPAVYLCVNRVAPAHEGLELGIGDATLIKVSWQKCSAPPHNLFDSPELWCLMLLCCSVLLIRNCAE